VSTYATPVTIHRRVVSGQDTYGNDLYTDADELVDVIAFAPGASVEVTQGRDTITTQPAVYLPTGTIIDGLSAVTADGVRYDVDGNPNVWRSPFSGWAPGIEVRLKAVTG
jgi:hypothetical protein